VSDRSEADLQIAGLRLWVHGRQFPEAEDYWDGNWLNITAECVYPGSWVEVSGPVVHVREVQQLLEGCERLYATLEGAAGLECMEPNLRVKLAMGDKAGHIKVSIALTPEHLTESHQYEDWIDQTFLPPIIAACRRVLDRYPTRGRVDS